MNTQISSVTAILIAIAASAAAAEKSETLPTFEEACFELRPAGSFLPIADARQMLESIGQDSRIFPGDRDKARLKGLFRVRGWTPESVVRVALSEPGSHLRIHLWGAGHGVSLFLTPAGAAYRLGQQPSEAMLKQDVRSGLATLVTTDDRRGARLPHSAYQIRCQQQAVVVTKGDVRVMTVTLEGPATDLYLQVPGDATLQDLALLRVGPVPEELPPAHRIVLDGMQPAGLSWKATLPKGARFQKLDVGSVELAVRNTAEIAMASVAVAERGLFEVIAEVDEATPGTGIALFNAKGEALDGIEFGREGNKTLAFGFGSPKGQPWLGNFDFANRPVSLAGPRQWLRLVLVGGLMNCWISGDGVHWGRVLGPRDCPGPWQSIAIYARAANDRSNSDNSARHIRVRNLQVRELSGLTTAAAADLLAKAATAGVAMKTDRGESPQAWTERVARLAPEGSSRRAWRYACTLHALAASVQADAGEWLLYRAVRDSLGELRSTRAKIDLLQDAALLWRPRQDSAYRQVELWERLGRELVNAGTWADFELYRQGSMQASLGEPPDRSGPMSWELARDATMLFYVERRNADLARMESLCAFWRASDPQAAAWPVGQQLDRLLLWLNVQPARKSARRRSTALDTTRMVIPPVSRAATNILSEVQSALEVQQYSDAARVLVTCDPPRDAGLVPAPDDDQLFVSFRTALRLLMFENRGLREAMVEQIGPADQLKIEQTLAQGDPAAVEALPLQYCGTPAAVLPCQWLGDRALAAADLVHAGSWYDEGLRWASPAQQPGLAARQRLVSAMLGIAQGQPPAQSVSLGGVQVSPEKFEGWIRDQLSRHRTAAEVDSPTDSLPVVVAARPVLFQAASFGQLNDASGRGFKMDEVPYEFREIDWSWRHLTVPNGEDSLIAVERSRITAFDPAGGNVRWDVRLRNGWSSSPVRPLVRGQQIYIRASATPDRTGLACLDARTGRRLWLCDLGGTAASDPLWYRGRLHLLTIGPAVGQFVSPLSLAQVDPETGDVLSRRQIVDTAQRDSWPCECQASWAANRLIVLLAGSVISTDLQGRISWLRQETTLPYNVEPVFIHQYCEPAIESDGRLFVRQPGSCTIDCLALDTGRRCWQRGILGLQRMVDLSAGRLLAATARGLVALNKTNGEVLWQCEFPGMLSALARTSSGLVLGARQATIDNKPHLVILWIDAATGEIRAHGPLPLEKNQPCFFGPIMARGDRTWCCFGYGAQNDSPTAENPKRIMALRPGGPAPAGEPL